MKVVIDMDFPKSCLECPLCKGEYGVGNEKSYCGAKADVECKWDKRAKNCPLKEIKEEEE